jgi:chromosome segregation ATPase
VSRAGRAIKPTTRFEQGANEPSKEMNLAKNVESRKATSDTPGDHGSKATKTGDQLTLLLQLMQNQVTGNEKLNQQIQVQGHHLEEYHAQIAALNQRNTNLEQQLKTVTEQLTTLMSAYKQLSTNRARTDHLCECPEIG